MGCRVVDAQTALVRIHVDGPRLAIGRGPGRGAYVHPRRECVEAASRGGLAKSLRRAVAPEDVRAIAANLSPIHDNSQVATNQKAAGKGPVEAVETPLTGVRVEDPRKD